ncbi:MAG: insulinase family protein [Planctomycetes bacterium]|nr:insulinase family protein [Planctomycetota bacterium]
MCCATGPRSCTYCPSSPGRAGLAALAESTALRGSGRWTARRILDALDDCGLDRDSSTSAEAVSFWGTSLPRFLPQALRLYGEVLRKPRFAPHDVAVGRRQAEDAILSQEENPMRKVVTLAYRGVLGRRLGRDPRGRMHDLARLRCRDLRPFWSRWAGASHLQIVLAGEISVPHGLEIVSDAFGHWPARARQRSTRPRFVPRALTRHYFQRLQQTYLSLVWPSAPPSHPLHLAGQVITTILSGGSSSRLFTEVREKRALAYSIHAFQRAWRDGALLAVTASSTPRRAHETLKVCRSEIDGLRAVHEAELHRARQILRGQLLTWGEISDARASSLAHDFFFTGRARTLPELLKALEDVTLDDLRAYLSAFPPRPLAVVTLGSRKGWD